MNRESIGDSLANSFLDQKGKSDDFVQSMGEPWSKQTGKIAEKAFKAFKSMLREQQDLIIKRLKAASKPPLETPSDDDRKRALEDDYPAEFITWLQEEVFPDTDLDAMKADWESLLGEWLLGAAMVAGSMAYEEAIKQIDSLSLVFDFDKHGKFDFVDDQLLDWMNWRAETSAIDIVGTSAKDVRKLIYDTVMDGPYSVDKIQQALQGKYPFGNSRARMIARTEVLSSQSAGTFANDIQFFEDGMVIGKEWHATHDDRTRDDHKEADGQVRRFDEPFNVGGETLMYPRDEKGSAGQVIQCRCFYTLLWKGQDESKLG